MMDYNECIREKQLKNLEEFIECTDTQFNEFLSCVGWNENSIGDIQPPLICPFDSSHHLSEKKLEQHLEECQWKAEGYGDSDMPLSTPSVSANVAYCVSFDEQLQEDVLQQAKLKYPSMKMGTGGRLIPRTSDRLIADFTTDERRILYDYAVANTVQPDIGEDIADLNKPLKSNENKTSSYIELLAQERNLKRRRAKHRGVHTNKKSQIEIFREVINQQMEILAEYISEKNDCVKTETVDNSSYTSQESRIKNISNYERKNSAEKNNHHFIDNYVYNNRSRRSADGYHYENETKAVSKKSHNEAEHSKHRRKSSRERYRHRSRESDNRKHKKSHKRHHSKHRHRDKVERHRSRERESSRHSKKSKNGVKT